MLQVLLSTATTGANISGFEVVSAGAVSVTLPAASNTIGTVSFTGTGGTVAGVAAGATVSQQLLAQTLCLTQLVGLALLIQSTLLLVSAPLLVQSLKSLTATGIETATITNTQLALILLLVQ